ncbi:MAG: type II toxin-antitoxin system RelE/ParE family toxin [Ferruginibacter sp.]
MDYQIIWLPKAEARFQEIIEYLEYKWNNRVIEKFIEQTEKVLTQIKQRPTIFRRSAKMNIHEALVTKHNLLIYRINGSKIELLTFFDTRQDPKKKWKL